MEIATSVFSECEIGIAVRKWVYVGMSEKPSASSVCVVSAQKSSFTVNSLFRRFATNVHSVRGEAATLRERSKWITPRTVQQG